MILGSLPRAWLKAVVREFLSDPSGLSGTTVGIRAISLTQRIPDIAVGVAATARGAVRSITDDKQKPVTVLDTDLVAEFDYAAGKHLVCTSFSSHLLCISRQRRRRRACPLGGLFACTCAVHTGSVLTRDVISTNSSAD